MKEAVFLDRDGVINEVLSHRVKFVNKPEDFYLLDRVGQAIKIFNEEGFKVFVVTNQGGIGLGFMKESALHAVHKKMEADLAAFGANIDDIAYCPHKPKAACACRKPKPQMILNLAKKHDVDVANSYMVGDRAPDIEAGREAGTQTVLVGDRKEDHTSADMYFPDLFSFAKWVASS
ncbi:D-glycero-beta-D-manno-heptose-1,7-bisphosphate 7-phosphatase [Virgibacillus profundi]|uniref:D,D-heptose 1,7-bisphosphate phosphatase n=1 Tax=Virgibacillus profundi TaxID=2024555 RepID=A0A2A2IIZ3_9BACI|nr:HAD family hydrolase [Virgibacillus profundi]PAV31597.1 D-glycero-beta-D-manno-heptose-1,7-bisphosphate 7-phosphatase [Virgibacillus profundi]PXY55783.1 HAD family hydrolase [Virgibacillus profundi]